MGAGAGFPERFASILRMSNAELPCHDKPFFMASRHGILPSEDASANMRRLFGSRGANSQQDALFPEEAAESRASDEDSDALAAYRSAKKKQGASKKKKDGLPRRGGVKVTREPADIDWP